MRYNNKTYYIFTAVKYSFLDIFIIFNQYFSVFYYFVYNKSEKCIFHECLITLYIIYGF